jgi:hypothetical protein
MKTKSLMAALVVGMLATLPAHAFPYFNRGTYASRFRPAQPAPATRAQSQPTSSQPNSELQVAVMAKSQAGATANNFGGDMWYGSSSRSRATHSH